MRHRIFKVLFLLALSQATGYALTVIQAATLSLLQQVYNKNQESVVLVRNHSTQGDPQLCTGFFVSTKGHLLTTALEGHQFFIEVDRRLYPAALLGSDTLANVALLKVDFPPEAIQPIPLSERGNLPQLGDRLVSLSYKLALNVSPQKGYVTGLNDRYFQTEWPITLVRSTLTVDGGDCGGPVFDTSGQCIGMLLHTLSETRETYFMPALALNKIYSDLLLFGRVRYGYLGITTETVFDREQEKLREQVIALHPQSPAQKAGIQPKDILLELNHREISSREVFKQFVFFAQPQQSLHIKLLREDKVKDFFLRIAEKPKLCPGQTEAPAKSR
jgi:serine protease Do